MRFLTSYYVALIAVLSSTPRQASCASSFCGLQPGPIEIIQPLKGASFLGKPAQATELRPKFQYQPETTDVHLDGGNTNTEDALGPLGNNITITSVNTGLQVLLTDTKDQLFGAYDGPCNGSTHHVPGIVELDPDTLDILASWTPPDNITLNLAYIELLTETDEILVSSLQGLVYIVSRTVQHGQPVLTLNRTIDIASTGVLEDIQVLNTIFDASGNLWFTTGLVRGVLGTTAQKATIAGYITPNGGVHSISIPNQMPENGLTINNDTAFLITGPTYADDHADAVGFLMALQPDSTSPTGVNVLWNSTYDAGSTVKPGSFARGSGSTPALLGNDFLAVTDASDTQLHLLIYRQSASGPDVAPICSVPLFTPGHGANDNGPVVHFDGESYHVVVQSMYGQPGYTLPNVPDVNGPFNNLSAMTPGLAKVIVSPGSNSSTWTCTLNWTNPTIRMTTLPVLSTATGLLYGHVQDYDLAVNGEYVWYIVAWDWGTGKEVWRRKTGAGGGWNDGYKNIILRGNGNGVGTMYQIVRGGVVMARDG